MAGVEKEFRGEVILNPGYTVGYLEQEPRLPAEATVREVVEDAVRDVVALLKEYEEINAKFSEPMADDAMNALLERQGTVQEKLDAQGGWDLDSRLDMAMDALRCPGARHEDRRAVGRREKARGAVSPPAEKAGHPPARRADQPPGRGDSGVAGAPPRAVRGHRDRGDARPLLSRQRGRLDPRAGPRRRHPMEGQLLRLAGTEEGAPAAGGKAGVRQAADPSEGAGMDQGISPRPAGQEQGPRGFLRVNARRGFGATGSGYADLHSRGAAAWKPRHRGPGPAQGLRREHPFR